MTKLLKVTISGSFVAGDKEIESYNDVTGLIPALDDDKAQQMVNKRYARMWIGQATDDDGQTPLYKRVGRVREVFIDSIEEVDDEQLSYVGKNIMQMTYEELQDLAAAKDLASIPLYKIGSLTTQRRIAFAEYSTHVLDEKIDHRKEGYNPAKYAPIEADDQIRRSGEHVALIEESIDKEALVLNNKATTSQSALTLDQLKAIATGKKIAFNANIGYKALYDKIYKENAA